VTRGKTDDLVALKLIKLIKINLDSLGLDWIDD
jgi:hypothetical protein